MNQEELWKVYTDKNPDFLTKGFFFKPEYLKKFFDQTYRFGYMEGCENKAPSEAYNPIMDFLTDMNRKY